MGSFAYTCCISGLPIHWGDEIRYFLLTEHPFYEKVADAHGLNGLWVPRTFPLKAKYDDYGRAEEVEEGLAKDIWLEGFQTDLLERGTGDNCVHDVPVRKGMIFEKLMLAVQESRLRVRLVNILEKRLDRTLKLTKELLGFNEDEVPEVLRSPPKKLLNPGIPTLKRVRKILKSAGFKVSDCGFSNAYLINRKSLGVLRIRFDYGTDTLDRLKAIQPILDDKFSTSIVVKAGHSSRDTTLFVRPKPELIGQGVLKGHKKIKRLVVAQAMVREDVWQALLDTDPDRFLDFQHQALEMWDSYKSDPPDQFTALKNNTGDNLVAALVRDDFCLGWMSHYLLMLDHNPEGEVLQGFLKTVAETVFIQNLLSRVRYQWHPSTSVGPQFGEWDQHALFLRALAGVADRCYQKASREEDDRKGFRT